MTVTARLGELQQRYDQIERAADFAALARLLLAGRGQFSISRDIARTAPRLSERVRRIMAAPESADFFVRAAQLPQTLAGTPALSEYKVAAAGFAASLANVGVFDRLLGTGFRRLPMGLMTVGAINVGAVGAVVDEGSVKPISSLSLSSAAATARKATALLVLTAELARATQDVDTLIGAELRRACVRAIDGKFLAIATAGAPTASASGSNLQAFFGDLAFAINAIGVDDTSHLCLIVTSAIAKQLALLLSQGSASSTAMTPSGGLIAGMETIVSDALSVGQMVLLDASAFAAASSDLTLSTMTHASVQFDTSPDSPATAATNLISLWQLNQLGLLAERFFLVERLRAGSVALVTGASYASGFSP